MQSYLKVIQRSSWIRKNVCSIAPLNPSRQYPIEGAHLASVARAFSSTAPTGSYVAVDHSGAYENSMQGPHGRQLALARLEGAGKDDPTFDPFAGELSSNNFDDDDIFEDDATMVEAELDDEEDGDDEDEEDDDEFEGASLYNPDGSLRRKKSVLATLRAGFPSGGQFAVIELGGAQFKVTTDDVIVANRLQPVSDYKIGSVHTLKEVMLVGSSHMTLVGMPFVVGAEVDIMVEEITRDAKVIVFKKRRRKNSQRKNGFRRDVSLLRVLDVRMPEEYRNHTHIGREIVDTLGEHFDQMPPVIPSAKMQSSTTI